MRLDHKLGSDYGIDYGVVVLYLLWIAATIALQCALAVRSHGQSIASVEYCFCSFHGNLMSTRISGDVPVNAYVCKNVVCRSLDIQPSIIVIAEKSACRTRGRSRLEREVGFDTMIPMRLFIALPRRSSSFRSTLLPRSLGGADCTITVR
jgi:hypothetical protein